MGLRILLISFFLPTLLWGQLTCEDEFLLSGSAVLQGECIRMTPNATGQIGCAWFNDLTDFGNVDVTSGTRSKTYTITNVGGGTLTLNGGSSVSISGTNASDFTVTSQPGATTLNAVESTYK